MNQSAYGIRELSSREVSEVSGAVYDRVIGGIAGGIGGFVGGIIGGNQNTTGWDLARATAAGAIAGVVNPIRGISGAVAAIGGGIASGGTVNVLNDVEVVTKKKD